MSNNDVNNINRQLQRELENIVTQESRKAGLERGYEGFNFSVEVSGDGTGLKKPERGNITEI